MEKLWLDSFAYTIALQCGFGVMSKDTSAWPGWIRNNWSCSSWTTALPTEQQPLLKGGDAGDWTQDCALPLSYIPTQQQDWMWWIWLFVTSSQCSGLWRHYLSTCSNRVFRLNSDLPFSTYFSLFSLLFSYITSVSQNFQPKLPYRLVSALWYDTWDHLLK